ncbi:hypothetical protein [Nostoc sp.]|uniref:hypothetical protein n=1 Tax=Nostoc sp. TaxID=1180 RepID=UPI002FF4D6AC
MEAVPELMGAAPELMGVAPELMGAVPELMGAPPELMGVAPELMGAVPELMGVAPELMGAVLELMGAVYFATLLTNCGVSSSANYSVIIQERRCSPHLLLYEALRERHDSAHQPLSDDCRHRFTNTFEKLLNELSLSGINLVA